MIYIICATVIALSIIITALIKVTYLEMKWEEWAKDQEIKRITGKVEDMRQSLS